MVNNDNRKSIEKKIHDDFFSGTSNFRKKQVVFYPKSIKKTEIKYIFDFFGEIKDKKVLILGVGNQTSLIDAFIDSGAEVVAIDLSSESVKRVRDKIFKTNSESKCSILEMDCENLTFESHSFDFVFGRGIIHHLDIEKSLQQIQQVLKRKGKFGFIEPLATNPVIQLYRYLTPLDRTPDEHPFKSSDLRLFSKRFHNVHFKFLYALTLLSFPIRILTNNDKFFFKVFNFLNRADELLINIPGYRVLCWDVIITGKK